MPESHLQQYLHQTYADATPLIILLFKARASWFRINVFLCFSARFWLIQSMDRIHANVSPARQWFQCNCACACAVRDAVKSLRQTQDPRMVLPVPSLGYFAIVVGSTLNALPECYRNSLAQWSVYGESECVWFAWPRVHWANTCEIIWFRVTYRLSPTPDHYSLCVTCANAGQSCQRPRPSTLARASCLVDGAPIRCSSLAHFVWADFDPARNRWTLAGVLLESFCRAFFLLMLTDVLSKFSCDNSFF